MFKLVKLNSEFKYVANSVVRDTPTYAYPAIIDIHEWQRGLVQRLDDWAAELPVSETQAPYLWSIGQISYLSLKLVLLRPSPAIPNPTSEALKQCHAAARLSITLYIRLYRSDLLVYSWDVFYSLTLTVMTMLYCVKALPGLAPTDIVREDLNTGLRVLAATGEHWSGAKRCHDILHEMGDALISSLREREQERGQAGQTIVVHDDGATGEMTQEPGLQGKEAQLLDPQLQSGEPWDQNLFGGLFSDQLGLGDASDDMDAIMRNLFDDFIPSNNGFMDTLG